MIRATASSLELLSACQWWVRPGVEWSDSASDDAALGTEVDKLFTAYVNTGRFAAPEGLNARTLPIFGRLKAWFDDRGLAGMRSQVVFCYHPELDAGRAVEVPADAPARFYTSPEWRERLGITDEEICGTADLVCLGEDAEGVYVDLSDLKVRVGVDVKDATSQLAGLALFAARAWGVERARIRTLVADEARVEEREVWLDGFDFATVAGELSARLADVATSEPRPGEHCTERYCPALLSCPAKARDLESAEQLVPVDALVARRVDGPLSLRLQSPDHAADVLARVRAIRKACDQLAGAVEEYVGEGVTLSDGSTFGPTFRTVSRVSSKAIEQLARDKGATDEEIALCVSVAREGAGIRVVRPKAVRKGRAA